jgi:ABC1 atypical kinase-like domain
MEFVEGVPLLDPLDYESRRDAARLVFRRLMLGPLFSGLPESIFHADPHAGNLRAQTQKPLRKPFLTLDGTPISMPGWKPSHMPAECLQAKPSCEPGAFYTHTRGSAGPISIVPDCPGERSRLISRARSETSFVQMQNKC